MTSSLVSPATIRAERTAWAAPAARTLAAVGGLLLAVALVGCELDDIIPPRPETDERPVAEKPGAARPQSGPAAKAATAAVATEAKPAGARSPAAKEARQELAGPAPNAEKAQAPAKPEPAQQQPEKPRDLGPPLVENAEGLKKIGEFPAWLDPQKRRVVLVGEVCGADYPLEFFATLRDRGYESVTVIDAQPSKIHAVLLLLGATPGWPSGYADGKLTLASGTELAIELRWKDKQGKVQSAPAQHWIRNRQTKKELDSNWVFAGSRFWKDEQGKDRYAADSGDFICVLNNPSAMIDLPVRSSSAIEDRLFETFTEHIPPVGTAVTILITPKLSDVKQPAAPTSR